MKRIYLFSFLTILSLALCAQTKRVVEEEFTGTHCGWCVRGIAGIEASKQKYGDRLIVIAVHGDVYDPTPMSELSEKAGYDAILSSIQGFPACKIDRQAGVLDPYFGRASSGYHITEEIDEQLSKTPPADLTATASWKDTNFTEIEVKTNVNFYQSGGNYRLIYVLTADSLKGKGSAWYQLNYYYNMHDDPEIKNDLNLAPYTKESKYIKNMSYNYVPIDGKGVFKGLEGSLPETITAGSSYEHSVDMRVRTDIFSNIRREYLHAVVMLFNRQTSQIDNAIQIDVPPPYVTEINTTSNQTPMVTAYYTLDGRRISYPQRGLNILRFSDGSTRKVIVTE